MGIKKPRFLAVGLLMGFCWLFLFMGGASAESIGAQKLTGKFANKFFYDIYDYPRTHVRMVDLKNKEKKLFSIGNYLIDEIEVIAKNKLGYYIYGFGNNKSRIFYYNFATKKKVLVKKVSGGILQLGWQNSKTYAYLTEKSLSDFQFRWTLYLVSNGKTKKLKSWKGDVYGRGGYYEDSNKLQFSPNGKKIMHIKTGSIRDVSDYNVYIFNRVGKLTNRIKSATHPVWVSNNKIVYRRYATGSLYAYNLKTKKSKKLSGTPAKSYNPTYLPGTKMIAFWGDISNPRAYTYNLATKKLKKVASNAAYPQWLNTKKLVVNSAKYCDPYMEMCPQVTGAAILNLKTKKLKKITNNVNKNYFTQYK